MSPWRQGPGYVVANLAVAGMSAAAALLLLRMSSVEVGLRGNRWTTVVKAAAVAALLTVPLYALAASNATAHLVADERAAQLGASEIAFNMLVRIPLGTALAEELVFRGVLYGTFRRAGRAIATVGSSVAFGLWHVRPALASIRANLPDAGEWTTALLVLSALVITAVAGALFCWLREKAGGIAAPWAFHATLNSLALGAAALAHNQ